MKLTARISTGALQRRFARLAGELEPAVLDAAADAFAKEPEAARPGEGLPMRAAVLARVRDVVAAHAGKHKRAALRAILKN